MANAANSPTEVYFVAGSSYEEREAWIATAISQQASARTCGVLLEGLPCGSFPLESEPHVVVERIAPGCFCCIGNLVMRVTLNRMVRQEFHTLYIAINDAEHLAALQASLSSEAYLQRLQIKNCKIL